MGAAHSPTIDEVVHAPVFILNGFASSLSSLLGLVIGFDGDAIDRLNWGRPLLVVALSAAGWRLWRLERVSPSLASVLSVGVSFWGLVALAGGGIARQPSNPRYLILGAVFVILIVAELWRDARPRPTVIAVALTLAALSVVGNLSLLGDVHRFLEGTTKGYRAALGAGEIAGDRADPSATPIPPVTLDPYLAAVRDHGSPAYSPEELSGAPEAVTVAADRTFASLYGLAARPVKPPRPSSCERLAPAAPSTVEFGAPGVVVVPDGTVQLALRRYAESQFPIDLGEIAAGGSVAVDVPQDGSEARWTLAVTAAAPTRICVPGTGATTPPAAG